MKSNPFSTRFVRPGRLPWIAPPGLEIAALAAKFSQLRQALIVGPHGSGKSTLLQHLAAAWIDARSVAAPRKGAACLSPRAAAPVEETTIRSSRRTATELGQNQPGIVASEGIVWATLRRGEFEPGELFRAIRASGVELVVIDGWEQLSLRGRLGSGAYCRRRAINLLATSHRATPLLPTLCYTQASAALVGRLVQQLVATQATAVERRDLCDEDALAQLLHEEKGNVREVLMRLYDQWESAHCHPTASAHQALTSA